MYFIGIFSDRKNAEFNYEVKEKWYIQWKRKSKEFGIFI